MRDSVNGHLIPPGTPVVAGYADGIYAWSQDMWDAHPDAVHLSIAVHPDHQADILDVERFDATPADVPGWIDRFSRPARRRPTVYCARSAIDAVRGACAPREFDWWAATLDGTTSVPGAVAVQFADYGGYDESVILDPTWVGAATVPTVDTPSQSLQGDELMTMDGARILVWMFRLQLFGPAALSEPNAQAAVDAFAARIAGGENAEAVLTALLEAAQIDGRLDARYRVAPGA
jgi:hypothetical protein